MKQENKFFFNKTDLYKKKEKEEERITKRERERERGEGKKLRNIYKTLKNGRKERKKKNNSNLNLRDWFNML